MSVSFIFGENSEKRIYSIRMFDGLNPIGEISSMIGSQVFRGKVHGEEFELFPQTPISGMINVSCKIYKYGEFAGTLRWSKSDLGSVYLLKKTRGNNQFHIKPLQNDRHVITEMDGVQKVGIIDVDSKETAIWTGEVASPQRPAEQVHELMLYCAFLLEQGITTGR